VEYNTSTNPTFEGAVRDTSGRGNDGVFYGGASYDATEKALVFDGSDDFTEVDLGKEVFKNSSIHTTSLWVKMNHHDTDFKILFSLGNGEGNPTGNLKHINLYHSSNHGLRLSFTQHDYRLGEVVPVGQWVHVAYTYDGTTWQNSTTPTNVNIYINGVKVGITSVYQIGGGGGSALDLTTAQLALGAGSTNITDISRNYTDADLSQFKLYDCVLTAEEVKTLYDMGRTGHIVNPQPLHIAAPVQVEKTLRIPIDNTDTGAYTAGMIRYNQDLGKIQVHSGSVWLTVGGGVSATGGTVTYADGYTIHTFTDSGTFTVVSGGEVEYLVVAGGGAGGYNHGGGGGGGGVLTGTLTNVSPGTYTITRGAGGTFVIAGTGGNGSNSTALGLTAIGGGGGGRGYGPNGSGQAGTNGSSGGSGGGGGPFHVGGAGTAGPPIQGYVGGNGINDGSQAGHGGGGGGAGGVGGDGLISGANNQGISGKGGIGLVSLISGSSSQYAGGGSGGRWGGSLATDVAGGVGSATGGGGIGGALSADPYYYYATAGGTNTGGGGGGAGDGGANGANGGSGIVIIRYL